MSLSMYSVIPCPQVWDDRAASHMLSILPLIGAIIGALWYGFSVLLVYLSVPVMLCAALILLFPLFMSGFLHMDGYMDTCDAIFSRADLHKKRDILKDSHVGAFAVIALCVYLLTGFAAIHAILERGAVSPVFIFVPVLSRCTCAIAALNINPISESGYAAAYKKNAKPSYTAVLLVCCALCLVVGAFMDVRALAVMCAALAGGLALCFYSTKQLGGISGDLCGFIITGGELCALLAMSVL